MLIRKNNPFLIVNLQISTNLNNIYCWWSHEEIVATVPREAQIKKLAMNNQLCLINWFRSGLCDVQVCSLSTQGCQGQRTILLWQEISCLTSDSYRISYVSTGLDLGTSILRDVGVADKGDPDFISMTIWPPNIPDLNPVVGGRLQDLGHPLGEGICNTSG